MSNDLIYVYGILNSPRELSNNPLFVGLKCIPFRDLFIVIRMVSDSEFSEENLKKNLADMAWLDTYAREHIRIIGLLMDDGTVIPFNFGTIYTSEDSLIKFSNDYHDSFIENFKYIEGKEEWAIKIYCNTRVLCNHIDELSSEAADLEKQIMASSPGKAFLLRRKKSDLIENEMNRLTKVYGQEYFNEIKKMSEATALNNVVPKELTGRDDTMILNAAFLIFKNKSSEFMDTVSSIKMKYACYGFDIETSGPWPPYSFIFIKESF